MFSEAGPPTAVPGYAAVCGAVLYGRRGREAHLRAVFDVVSFVEAEVTKVVGRRPFAGSARLWGQGQVGEMVRQGAQAVCDVVEGAVRRGALEEVVVQHLMKAEEDHTVVPMPSGVTRTPKDAEGCNMAHLVSISSPAPRGLFQRRERLESRFEAEEHVFLIIPEKEKKSGSQISLRSFHM